MSALIASAKDNIERIVADISQEAGLSDGVRFGA